MTAAHEQLYRRTLHALVAAGVPFVGLGTFALRQQCPALPRRLVADCDIQLPADAQVLMRLVTLLQTAGWQVTLWEQPVPLPLTAAALAGKYYLRARRAGAVLDCSYEHDDLLWPAFQAVSTWQQGLPLAGVDFILQQKAQLHRPTDQALLRWWQRQPRP